MSVIRSGYTNHREIMRRIRLSKNNQGLVNDIHEFLLKSRLSLVLYISMIFVVCYRFGPVGTDSKILTLPTRVRTPLHASFFFF